MLSGDHIYKMDYSQMLRRHRETGAACTISVMEVPWEEASRFGIMAVDENDLITEFAEKPRAEEQPRLHGHLHLHVEQTPRVPHRRRG